MDQTKMKEIYERQEKKRHEQCSLALKFIMNCFYQGDYYGTLNHRSEIYTILKEHNCEKEDIYFKNNGGRLFDIKVKKYSSDNEYYFDIKTQA